MINKSDSNKRILKLGQVNSFSYVGQLETWWEIRDSNKKAKSNNQRGSNKKVNRNSQSNVCLTFKQLNYELQLRMIKCYI